jgi:hypothetical protein
MSARLVALLIRQMWRPPGIDVLGRDTWIDVFEPVLRIESFWTELLRLDSLIESWLGPAARGLAPIATFRASLRTGS